MVFTKYVFIKYIPISITKKLIALQLVNNFVVNLIKFIDKSIEFDISFEYKSINNAISPEHKVAILGKDPNRRALDSSIDRQAYFCFKIDRVSFGSISGYVGYYDLEKKKTTYF